MIMIYVQCDSDVCYLQAPWSNACTVPLDIHHRQGSDALKTLGPSEQWRDYLKLRMSFLVWRVRKRKFYKDVCLFELFVCVFLNVKFDDVL